MLHLLKFLTGPVGYKYSTAGSNNNVFRISIGMQTKYPKAVEIQERYEQLITRLVFLLVGVPLGILAGSYSHPIAGVLVAMMSVMLSFITPLRRWLESRGTALDIAYAVQFLGADLEEYEEAKVTARERYAVFKGWPREDIKALLVSLRPWAGENAGKWG